MQGATSEAGPDTGLAMCCGQAGCWTDGDASEAARRVSDFLVGAPRVATRVSEIQYQCEGGPQRNRLVPSASSVSNEVKSLCHKVIRELPIEIADVVAVAIAF